METVKSWLGTLVFKSSTSSARRSAPHPRFLSVQFQVLFFCWKLPVWVRVSTTLWLPCAGHFWETPRRSWTVTPHCAAPRAARGALAGALARKLAWFFCTQDPSLSVFDVCDLVWNKRTSVKFDSKHLTFYKFVFLCFFCVQLSHDINQFTAVSSMEFTFIHNLTHSSQKTALKRCNNMSQRPPEKNKKIRISDIEFSMLFSHPKE